MTVDWLIVGAGFTGSVLAERLASNGRSILLIDRRNHLGGNAHDAADSHGVLVHPYGPHLFHTNSPVVWAYLSQYTAWRRYEHRVRAMLGGNLVPLPFNLTAIRQCFGPVGSSQIVQKLLAAYGPGRSVPVLDLVDSADPTIKQFGVNVRELIFDRYTYKQWGLLPDQLDRAVTGRVPVRLSHDDRYFTDRYQAIPELGYSELFRRLLDHPNIRVLLGTSYESLGTSVKYRRLIFTGAIDEFFGSALGTLPYRSISMVFEHSRAQRMQPVATINYPQAEPFTRTTEFKLITGQECSGSTLVREYPEDYSPGHNEPFYPVPRPVNRLLYQRYVQAARQNAGPMVTFAGRLGTYQYLNMDQAVGQALSMFGRLDSGDSPLASPPPRQG